MREKGGGEERGESVEFRTREKEGGWFDLGWSRSFPCFDAVDCVPTGRERKGRIGRVSLPFFS